MQVYDYERIKKQVNAEFELNPAAATANRVLNFLLKEIFMGSEDEASKWMKSDYGGYSDYEISRAFNSRYHNIKKNQSKALVRDTAF